MPAGLLEPLVAAGLMAMVRDDGVLVVGPRTRITDELRAYIRGHRGDLVAAMRWDEASANDQLRTTLRRCDAAWTRPGVFSEERSHRRLIDLEEAFHIAFHAKDRLSYEAALADYERFVIESYLADVSSQAR